MPTRAELEWWQRTVGATPDGKPGPETFARTVAFLRALERDEQPTSPGTPDALARAGRRDAIVAWAESFLTEGPPGGRAMRGELDPVARVWPYVCPAFARPELRHTKSWCGGFALLAWKSCLPACAAWVWRDGVGFLGPYGVHTVALPEPGDVRVSKYAEGSTDVVWHHSIVTRVLGDGRVETVDGNTLAFPREGVTRRTVALIRDGVAYYSAAVYL